MQIKPFKLERYFAKYEFAVKYLLSSSDCDGLTQAELLSWADHETKSLWDNLSLGYTEYLGLPALRTEIAQLYHNISPEEVLVAVPVEGILLTMLAILKPNDHVICTWPGYQALYELANAIGCEVDHWEIKETPQWHFDINELAAKIKPNTKLLIINFPHNPTGYLPSKTEFAQIIALARQHNLYIFSDEMYRFLELNPADRLPAACELYDKAITLFGMSKTYGLAGLRIGWLITKDRELFQKMARLKDYTTMCSSAPSEVLALIGLRAGNKIIQRHVARFNKNLDLLDQFFAAHKELFTWQRPKAGTIAFPRTLFNCPISKFSETLTAKTSIMLLPGTVYDYGEQHFRLGFGRESLPQVLEVFADYLRKNPDCTK